MRIKLISILKMYDSVNDRVIDNLHSMPFWNTFASVIIY